MSNAVWHLRRGPTLYGPYTWDQLAELARSGHVEPGDLIWTEGDPTIREARSIPGLLAITAPPTIPLPAPPPPTALPPPTLASPLPPMPVAGPPKRASTRRTMIIVGGALVAVVAVLLAVVLTRNGGSSDTTGTTAHPTTAAASTTAAQPPTSTVGTTAAPTSTAVPTTERTTTSPPTAPPPTTVPIAIPTSADLVAAMPDPHALPPGYTSTGGAADTILSPGGGPTKAVCGLANSDLRAQDHNVVANAGVQTIYTAQDGQLSIKLYGFSTASDASTFIADTRQQASSCPDGFWYDIMEGPAEDQIKVFSGDFGDNECLWHVAEAVQFGTELGNSADEGVTFGQSGAWDADYQGVTYHFDKVRWDVYERYGNIVLKVSLYGESNHQGFASLDIPQYTPTEDALVAVMSDFRTGILDELHQRSLIP